MKHYYGFYKTWLEAISNILEKLSKKMSAKFEMLNKIENLIFLEADLLDQKWQNWLDLHVRLCNLGS